MFPLNSEQKWQLVVAGVTMGIAVILSVVFLVILKSGQNIPQISTNPDLFPDFQPAPTSTGITLYDDFVFDDIISSPNIIKKSRIIRLEGKLESGSLYVKASARPEFCWDKARKHSIYFYIDSGDNGGHIDTERKDAVIVRGGFTNDDKTYENTFPLTTVPVSKRVNGYTTIDVLSILDDQKSHYIGAFVATGKCGILDELRIDYTCKTPDCRITFDE